MYRFWRFVTVSLLSTFCFTSVTYSMGGKAEKIPMKTYAKIEIPDGEFLQYGDYEGGEKVREMLFVTRKEITNGKLYYRIYVNLFIPKENKKAPNYLNWPCYMIIDPVMGCTLESSGSISTNELEIWGKSGIVGVNYWRYRYYPESNYIVYESKSIVDKKTMAKHYKIDIPAGYSSFDMFSADLATRFMNPEQSGIFYQVAPDFMKDPLSCSFRYGEKAVRTVIAGTFKAVRLIPLVGDPFIGKLLEPMMSSGELWVEDSERRLLIETKSPRNHRMLELISNVITKK